MAVRGREHTLPLFFRRREGTMNKNYLIKALINGIITLVILSVLISLIKQRPFMDVLTEPYTIVIAVCAVIGSYIGFMIKKDK